jgi:hypothetical protein
MGQRQMEKWGNPRPKSTPSALIAARLPISTVEALTISIFEQHSVDAHNTE